MAKKKLSIGIQSFKNLIEEGYIYVDKTEWVYRIATEGSAYFLSRPRRFGKSLLISTLKELFRGNERLFRDTWLYNRWDWSQNNPVIHISFVSLDYDGLGLAKAIDVELQDQAERFGIIYRTETYKARFRELIQKLSAKHGRVVILIDEYDKPIIDYLEDVELTRATENQAIMRHFYSVLKDAGEDIRLLFITGVSKFSKVSIFSELNHLNDISMDETYAILTGYTQHELEFYFEDYIQSCLLKFKLDREAFLDHVRDWYNGFSWDGVRKVYNPFGILNFFQQRDFRNFWFSSATPTFLLTQMKKFSRFDLENIHISVKELDKADLRHLSLESLLFQTGYLTIKEKDSFTGDVVLDYPNKEVRDSFYSFLIERLACRSNVQNSGVTIADLSKAFNNRDMEAVREIINAVLSDLPYETFTKQTEGLYHGLIHIMFKYLDMFIRSEVHTNKGRLDSVVETETDVYIFEFKFNQSAEEALGQIQTKNYAQPYRSGGKRLLGVGVNFDTGEREITGWLCREL